MDLFEGGNLQIGEITADHIDFTKVSRSSVVSFLKKLCRSINKVSGFKIFGDDITSLLNGSSSFSLSNDYSDEQIINVKPRMGDIDMMVSEEYKSILSKLLKEPTSFDGIAYLGGKLNNAGSQFNGIFRFNETGLNIQIDFEFVEFDGDKPNEFYKFSHSSTYDDMLLKIKGVHHKLLLRAVTRAVSLLPNVVIATEKSTPNSIKISTSIVHQNPASYRFSVDKGLRINAYEPMLDAEGKQVYYEGKVVLKANKPSDQNFIRNVDTISQLLFGKVTKDIKTFSGLVRIISTLPLSTKRFIASTYFNLLWGVNGQHIYRDDTEDFNSKIPAWELLCKTLKINSSVKTIEDVKYFY